MTDQPHSREAPDDSQSSHIDELSRIFSEVAELPREQQDAKLDELCPDANVRQQVRALLDADSSDDQLLDHSLVPKPLNVHPGERIADYQLLQELGQGGMGVVFMAEQLEPVRRKVALKVIKPGVDTREVIARFDAERQALSLMDHPNIAKVLDAGTTDAGRPYFVMELVKGQPIKDYCEQNGLSPKQRLELFLPVCHAIQHAHQKGIIHRDIKPSNVLVAEYDGRPVAKVIDFGIAKAINQPLTEMSVFTGFGQIVGTFEYMSPEQSRVNQLDVDTRSDIYSLGVLLYELLTGSPPFDKQRLRSVAWEEMLWIIREEDPPKPSARLSETTQPRSSSKHNENEPAKFARMVRGELDWIVMKAMEKDRDRRYETPNELASDIECFLNGDAVAACPPSAIYRFRKFAKRNKVAIATSAIVAASLVLGLIGTSWQAIRALKAEKAAAKSISEVNTINGFLTEDLFGMASAESQLSAGLRPHPNPNLTTLLDRALTGMDQRFAGHPQLRADFQSTLASSLVSVGRYEDATSLYEELLVDLKAFKGRNHADTIRVMRQLARTYIDQSRLDDAEPLCREALALSRAELGNEKNLTLRLLNDLAILSQKRKRYEKAEQAYNECLKARRRLLGDDHPDTLGTMSDLAALYESRNRFEDAEDLHTQVLEIHREIFSSDHPQIAASLSNLGRCRLKRGRRSEDQSQLEASATLLAEAFETYLRVRGADHPDKLAIQSNLSHAYCELGRHEDAALILTDLADRLKRLRGDEHVTTLEATNMLGWTLMQQDRLAEAENILSDTLEIRRRLSLEDPGTVQVMGNLASTYHRIGKLDKSILLDEETLKLSQQVLGRDYFETFSAMARLGLGYIETGQVNKGQTLLKKAFDTRQSRTGAFKIGGLLATSYLQTGDTENALVWTDRQIERARSEFERDSLQLANVLEECGTRLLRMQAWEAAEGHLRECFSIRDTRTPNTWAACNAQSMLGEALAGQQKYDEAKPLLIDAYRGIKERTMTVATGDNSRLVVLLDRIISFAEASNDPQEIFKWRREKADVLAMATL